MSNLGLLNLDFPTQGLLRNETNATGQVGLLELDKNKIFHFLQSHDCHRFAPLLHVYPPLTDHYAPVETQGILSPLLSLYMTDLSDQVVLQELA